MATKPSGAGFYAAIEIARSTNLLLAMNRMPFVRFEDLA
jgi:hypothetical protein